MKQASAIQVSRFKRPESGVRGSSCPLIDEIRKEFWQHIYLTCYYKLANFGWRLKKRNKLSLRGGLVALYGLLIITMPYQLPSRTVYADPILSLPSLQTVSYIKMPDMPAQNALERVLSFLQPWSIANPYAYGNCTALAASMVHVPDNLGNANTWDDVAAAEGYTVTSVPKPGAVAQSDTDSYLGHVAVVTAVDGNQVTLTEANVYGLGVVDERTVNAADYKYIYF